MKLSTLVQRALSRLNAIAAGVALLALVAWPALALAQNVSVVPSDTTLVNGDTFTVRVATDNSTDLRAYHLIYQYDHTKLQFMSASVGELALSHTPSAFLVPDVLSAAPDSVIYDVALLGSSANGGGILAYFTFKALTTASSTALTPLKVDFRNSLNQQSLPASSGAAVHINDVLAVDLGTGGITPVSCFAGNNGAIDITASGGVGPYSYSWSPGGATTEDLSGVAANTYTVTVTDANSRTVSHSWTVGQPTQLVASASTTAILCFGGNSTVTVSASGGTAPYTGTGSFSHAAGAYSYTVTDANGCTAVASGTITEPTQLVASSSATAILCFGGNSTVTVSASGGTAPYTGTGSFSHAAGAYSYTVTDANGCTSVTSGTITEPTQLVASSSATAILCFGGNSTVTVSASGGTAPYTGTGSFSHAAGLYSYTVTDANGCTSTTSGTITEPTQLVASSSATAILCFGGNSTVTVSASGGTPPYSGTGTFSHAAGLYSYTVTDANGCTATTGGTITEPTQLVASGVAGTVSCNGGTTTVVVSASGGTPPYSGTGSFTHGAGAYSYTVTDANGCVATATGTITEPTTLAASAVAGTIACNGGTTSVTVSATGGTPPYTGTGVFTVGAGLHSYTVTDASGCSASASVTVTEPAVLAASEVHTQTCLTSPDGSITLSVSGGTTPYSYLWTPGGATTQNLTGLAAGSYSVTVTDAHGCMVSVGPVAITVRTYTITPTAGTGGTISPSTAQVLNCGANQSFTITPADCYTFSSLVVDNVSITPVSPYTFTDVHADHTIVAGFTPLALPLPVTGITASRNTSGNGGSGITRITIGYTAPGDGSTVEIWRKGFGNYPEYDDGPGAGVPGMPASYPPAGWTLTTITASGQTDVPPARDYWYYVAYSKNACGQATVSADKTGGTLDYFLGDVHNGLADCAGNNVVDTGDITFLGTHYGAHLSDPDTYGCLDVGPTTTGWVDGRPQTDNQVEFEDLIMFAINYGTVSQPAMRASGTNGSGTLSLSVPATPGVGETFEAVLNFKGSGVQGLSAQLDFDASVVEPLAVVGGSLLSQQAGPAQVFSSKPGTVDAAVFGNGLSLTGAGDLALVRFRVKSAGDPGIALNNVRARDTRNQPVALMTPLPVDSQPMPTRMELAPSYPNPFTNALTVVFGMPMAGPVKLAVFDIQGRTVRHLLDGTTKAGWTRTVWNGRSDEGVMLAPGMYVIRLSAAGRVTTKSVRLVR